MKLTVRQTQVVKLQAIGWTNKEIAAELGVTRSAVEFHSFNARTRLGIFPAARLALWAVATGLIKNPYLKGA